MKFFIDTAHLPEIAEAHDMGILDGVTTNPSLMAKEGITGKANILQHYVNICNIVDGPVSAEVIAITIPPASWVTLGIGVKPARAGWSREYLAKNHD